MENFNRGNADIFSIEVDDSSKITFLEMARWTKFLAILGFIYLGIIVVGGIAFGLSQSSALFSLGSLGSIAIILICLLFAAIVFYPFYALMKYSTGIKTAIKTGSKQKFNESINYLKNVFKYHGILTIIGLGIYGLWLIIVIFAAISR